MNDVLQRQRSKIESACIRHGVKRLEAFGSSLRDDFKPDRSDLDFLVELRPMDLHSRVEAYFGLLDELRGLFGTRIDLVMVGAVRNPYIAKDIERTKQLIYAA
jgi:uncharacterized protein